MVSGVQAHLQTALLCMGVRRHICAKVSCHLCPGLKTLISAPCSSLYMLLIKAIGFICPNCLERLVTRNYIHIVIIQTFDPLKESEQERNTYLYTLIFLQSLIQYFKITPIFYCLLRQPISCLYLQIIMLNHVNCFFRKSTNTPI